jgi:hypothetical protein
MDWNATDYALLSSALAAQYADTETTKKALKAGGSETNPVLAGITPDQRGLLGAGLVGGAAYTLKDPKVRRAFLAGMTGFEGTVANQNTKGGRGKSLEENLVTPAAVGAALGALTYYLNDSDKAGSIIPYASGDAKHPAVGLRYSKRFGAGGFVGGFRPRR